MPPYTDMNSHSCCDHGQSSSAESSSSSRRPLHAPPSTSQRPLHERCKSKSNAETRNELLQLAATELEAMRSTSNNNPTRAPPEKQDSNGSLSSTGSNNSARSNGSSASHSSQEGEEIERSLPPACQALLHALPGNTKCHDCNSASATWASVSYGITLCLQCSGKHRGLGVQCSFIKSLTLDSWKRREILCMLEGGNEQLSVFFDRHQMGTKQNNGERNVSVGGLDRYRTKAASFYRQHLMSHAKQLAAGGMYKGREASRKSQKGKKSSSKHGTLSSGSGGGSSGKKSPKCRKKSREQLPTVAEKEQVDDGVDPACGMVGA